MLPYARIAGRTEFRDPKVLDVEALRRLWLPWISLEDHPKSHMLARNVSMIWHHARAVPADNILARPWVQVMASGGLRPFVLSQTRMSDHLTDEASAVPSAMQELRSTWKAWLDGDDELRRLQAVALLGNMTATLPVLETEEPDLTRRDPLYQHYCFERAKAIRLRDPGHEPSERVLEHLARHAAEPALRLISLVNLITFAVRYTSGVDRVEPWIEYGNALLPDLKSHPQWLAGIIGNHFYRVVALTYVKQKDFDRATVEIEKASAANNSAKATLNDDRWMSYIVAEGHSLIEGVKVRFQVRKGGSPDEVSSVIEDLIETEPHAESRNVIGDLFSLNDEHEEAAGHYMQAAAGGSIHGAIAAFNAYQSYQKAGDRHRMQEALYLLQDLDPSADIKAYET
ncbi:hypothetical protein ACFWFU_20750 [Streptomyces sp. NPDC060235]|uniref:hypothetical protein n=1 Tax=Streptomyces sp. NPDC060235 TaxID=3347080 RepID=UPI00365FBA31